MQSVLGESWWILFRRQPMRTRSAKESRKKRKNNPSDSLHGSRALTFPTIVFFARPSMISRDFLFSRQDFSPSVARQGRQEAKDR